MKLLPSRRFLCTPCNHATCHFMQSRIRKVRVHLAVTYHLHFWQNDRGHGGGTDTEIRLSTENWPWRRKFSRRSCGDSNPRPFDHESGVLTTELSQLPKLDVWGQSWNHCRQRRRQVLNQDILGGEGLGRSTIKPNKQNTNSMTLLIISQDPVTIELTERSPTNLTHLISYQINSRPT